MSTQADLATDFYRLDRNAAAGYAFDRRRPHERLTVELVVDGLQIGTTFADAANAKARDLGLGDGCCGFIFVLPETLLAHAETVEARIANLGVPVGAPLRFHEIVSRGVAPQGEVEWAGGLRFTGWAESSDDEQPIVSVFIDGQLIAEARAGGWRHVDLPRPAPRCAFDLCLPDRFADGRVWSASFRVGKGVELAGSPVNFVAAHGGLEPIFAAFGAPPGQRLTAQLFDRLMPGALPFSAYSDACGDFAPADPMQSDLAIGVLVLDGDRVEDTLASLDGQTHRHWACGVLPAEDAPLTFPPLELSEFLHNHSDGVDWFLFLAPCAILNANALARFAAAALAHPDASLIYADYDIADASHRRWPVALPAFDYERMLEQGYFAPIFLLPRVIVERALQIGAGNVFRLANLPFDDVVACANALHLPGSAMTLPATHHTESGRLLAEATLNHLLSRSVDASVAPLPSAAAPPRCHVRRRIDARSRVSILIPTRNRDDLLKACLESILPATASVRSEIIVIDNDSSDPQSLRYFRQIALDGVRILKAPGPFNFARIVNDAVREACGEYLCFLNNDVVARDAAWLEEMISRLADETTGAVGAKLLWPSGVVQHGGVTLGVNFGCVHAFRDRMDGDPGYHGALEVAHEAGAVTAACMTTRRSLFLELGGFDALRFPIDFNDVDYCLRVHAQGLRVVFTPHASLVHHESASRGRDQRRDASGRFRRELWTARHKWGQAFAADPFYSPLLALSDPPFSALSWPPRSLAPRSNVFPPAVQPPPGY